MNATQSLVFAIINPVAGSSDPETITSALKDRLGSQLVGIHTTSKDDCFSDIIAKAKEASADTLFVAGGDGTVSQVASHMVGTDLRLFVFPAGTANLLARCLQMPSEIEEALTVLKSGKLIHLDAIKVRSQHFFSHLSVGVYSNIAEQTPSSAKRRFGRVAYIWSGIKIIAGKTNWKFSLTLDGRPIKTKASTVMVANVGDVGAIDLQWGPNVSPSDGKLDICIIKSKTWKHYVRLVWEFVKHSDHAPSQTQHLTITDSLTIEASRPLPIRGDGEVVGDTPIKLELVPRALGFVVPRAENA